MSMARVRLGRTACALVLGVSSMTPARAEERTIVDEWNSVEMPPGGETTECASAIRERRGAHGSEARDRRPRDGYGGARSDPTGIRTPRQGLS